MTLLHIIARESQDEDDRESAGQLRADQDQQVQRLNSKNIIIIITIIIQM